MFIKAELEQGSDRPLLCTALDSLPICPFSMAVHESQLLSKGYRPFFRAFSTAFLITILEFVAPDIASTKVDAPQNQTDRQKENDNKQNYFLSG